MNVTIDGAIDGTRARLERIGRAELADDIAAGRATAAGVDGSLGSGRIWPSSDVDLTVVPADGPDWGVEWLVRDGVVIHKHINGWGLLNRLQQEYPHSFIEGAAEDWIRDPTWLLDGLASIRPVYDPAGKLSRLREFMLAHRFRPEVIEPRRVLLLQRASDRSSKAQAAFNHDDKSEGEWQIAMALEALALIWVGAAGRIISLKELDPELKSACEDLDAPDAHHLFRAAAGLTGLESHLPAIDGALAALDDLYSPWVDHALAEPGPDDGRVKLWRARIAYRRHQIHSARCAIPRDCWLHLATVRKDIESLPVDLDQARGDLANAAAPAPELDRPALQQRCEAVIDAFPLNPARDRIAALRALQVHTVQRLND